MSEAIALLDQVIKQVGTIDADRLRKVRSRLVDLENAIVLERARLHTLESKLAQLAGRQ